MISPKQKKILAFPYSSYDAIICDGAVRSGKTSIMTVAFIDWAMREFSGQRFGICGKTVDSATKNIVVPYISMAYAKKRYTLRWRRSDKLLEVSRGPIKNYFEVFGGKDESSFALIQGRTLAGVLIDEVALQPQSFVEQALARCSVDGSRFWFSCNPGSPNHWFYQNWILRNVERNALYLRFQLEDNPGLTPAIINRYKTLYSGVFYDRYIRGLWVIAEGLIYPMFTDECIVDTKDRHYKKYVVSMDYGIQNPTAMLLWGLADGVWYQVDEYYHSGRETNEQKTDQDYYDALCDLVGERPARELIIDPSASSFIALVNKNHRFRVRKANNDVLPGIQHTASCLQDGKIKVCRNCKRTIQEYGLYAWDDSFGEDRPIKDNDHCLTGDTLVDTLEGQKRIDELVGTEGLVYCTDSKNVEARRFHDVRMTREEADVFEITLQNGKKVKATAEHPFLTKRGWVQLKDLRTDDEVACIGGIYEG